MAIPTLKDKRIVVVGGGSGIGFAIAQGAIAEGARVTIGSTSADKINGAVERLGAGATGGVIDVNDDASVASFFGGLGPFDHLAFTAGDWNRVVGGGTLAEMDLNAVRAAPNVRFWGALLTIKHAQKHLAPDGSITLTDGVLSHRPMKGAIFSTAFGGAIEHLARALAVDLAPIRVNAVCPGLVLTEQIAKWPAENIERMTRGQPIPRAGDPDEVAQAYLYLMRGGFTTGQVIVVDGGRMLV